MMFRDRMTCLFLWCLLSILCSASFAKPVVQIKQGALQGVTWTSNNGRNISTFLGIPYAQPPIGSLRFAAPVAAGNWTGTWDASMDGNVCPQIQSGEIIGDEDCLYLNVYVPQVSRDADESRLLPVMVFLYGGALKSGYSLSSVYGPRYLLDEDVILVTFNYRVDALGFLSTGDTVVSGNSGAKDMVLALQWVQDNIVDFGGNNSRVTLFGESSGGAAVEFLALSGSTAGLFQQFLAQSGSAQGFWAYESRASYTKKALLLGEYFGCPTNTSAALVECLRKQSAAEIVGAQINLTRWQIFPITEWKLTDEPDVEGAFLTDNPKNLLAAGKIRDLPYITGTSINDADMMLAPLFPGSEALEELLNNFDELLPIVLQLSDAVKDWPTFTAKIKEFYFDNDLTGDRTQTRIKLAQLVSDTYFNHPAHKTVQRQRTFADSPIYFYTFRYRGSYSYGDTIITPWLGSGAAHADELFYLFPLANSLLHAPDDEWTSADIDMRNMMLQLWTSFATTGSPSLKNSSIIWTPYSSSDNYLCIGNGADASLEMQSKFLEKRMEFWDSLTKSDMETTKASSSLHS